MLHILFFSPFPVGFHSSTYDNSLFVCDFTLTPLSFEPFFQLEFLNYLSFRFLSLIVSLSISLICFKSFCISFYHSNCVFMFFRYSGICFVKLLFFIIKYPTKCNLFFRISMDSLQNLRKFFHLILVQI